MIACRNFMAWGVSLGEDGNRVDPHACRVCGKGLVDHLEGLIEMLREAFEAAMSDAFNYGWHSRDEHGIVEGAMMGDIRRRYIAQYLGHNAPGPIAQK